MDTNKKYYKALLKEPYYMTSVYGNMKYEMNEKYVIDGSLEMCMNGFHYTDHIGCIPLWYNIGYYDVFEVMPNGKILYDEKTHKYCSSAITIIRQLSDEEINELLDKDLDILVNDKNWAVRRAVAEHGRDKDLDILVYDEEFMVRNSVAKYARDKDINILIYDPSEKVRLTLAQNCNANHLQLLINDPNIIISIVARERLMVAHSLNIF